MADSSAAFAAGMMIGSLGTQNRQQRQRYARLAAASGGTYGVGGSQKPDLSFYLNRDRVLEAKRVEDLEVVALGMEEKFLRAAHLLPCNCSRFGATTQRSAEAKCMFAGTRKRASAAFRQTEASDPAPTHALLENRSATAIVPAWQTRRGDESSE
jgi:hypothetical protein